MTKQYKLKIGEQYPEVSAAIDRTPMPPASFVA
jgi:hypothetical protein